MGILQKVSTQERHGKRYLPEYQVWLQMKGRCHNPKNKRYPLYGARGIVVCERWMKSFQAFYDDLGPRPAVGLMLERKDNDQGYCPENCLWATQQAQVRNRRNNVWIEFQGKKQLVVDWAKELGMPLQTLKCRLRVYLWSVERSLTTPIGASRKSRRMLTHNGETMPMVQWAKRLNLDYKKLKSRIRHGWSAERALNDPT